MNQPNKTPPSSRSTQRVPFNDAFRGLAALKASMTQSAKAEKKAQKEVAPEEPPQEDTVGKTGAKVVVAIERKGHGGKTVTRVEGLDPGRIDDIGLDLKRSLGCGATVTDGVVFLQGDQRNRAADWLKQKGAKRVVVSA